MDKVDLDTLVPAWVEAQRTFDANKREEPTPQPILRLFDLPHEAPEEAWKFIEMVLHHPHFDEVRDILAAGPLEDLITEHGTAFIDRIEALARSSDRFRSLLGGVWVDSDDTPVWKRVYEAAKIAPPFPEGWRSNKSLETDRE
jgi:hypothetical protein